MNPAKHPLVMGILNVTPDSFSDGGKYVLVDAALKHAEKLVKEGADILDIGGESTRPGSLPISLPEEMQRVVPVIEKIRKNLDVRVSVDTTKFEVAEASVALGATLINDISGGKDIRMCSLLKDPNVSYILMHMQGTPKNMQDNPNYANGVVTDVGKFLQERVRLFREAGVKKEQIWVDPGIGFGKTIDHNLDLLRHLSTFKDMADRLVIGTSLKGYIGKVCGEERLSGTISSNLWAYQQGASVFRVHNVLEMKNALKMWDAISYGSF